MIKVTTKGKSCQAADTRRWNTDNVRSGFTGRSTGKRRVLVETIPGKFAYREVDRENVSVFTEKDVLTPAMREKMEAFYEKIDVDLFENEHQAHMKLCRGLAEAARKRGEEDKARRIELKARLWAEKHCATFFADLGKEVA